MIYQDRKSKAQKNMEFKDFKKKHTSPGFKENSNTISSKYISLLRSNKDMKKKKEKNEHRDEKMKGEIKQNRPTSMIKPYKNGKEGKPSSLFGNKRKTKEKSIQSRKSQIESLVYQTQKIRKSFKSPPANIKNSLKNKFLNSYNSQGKIKHSPMEKEKEKKKFIEFNLSKTNELNMMKNGLGSNNQRMSRQGSHSNEESGDKMLNYDNKQIMPYCLNHPNKKSKFFSNDKRKDETTFYGLCSKCAVVCVKQGQDCTEILLNQEQTREKNIKKFVNELMKEKENCREVFSILDNKQKELEDNFITENEKIESYFGDLIDLLVSYKLNLQGNLKTTFSESKRTLIEYKQMFKDYDLEFSTIYNDIDENYTSIIKRIELMPFQEIMGKYKSCLSDFGEMNNRLENTAIFNSRSRFNMSINQVKKLIQESCQMKKENKFIFERKEIDLEDNKEDEPEENREAGNILQNLPQSFSNLPCDISISQPLHKQSFKKTNYSKSDVYISFDKENVPSKEDGFQISNIPVEEQGTAKDLGTDRSTQKYINILEKINQSQQLKNDHYNQLLRSSNENPETLLNSKAYEQLDHNNEGEDLMQISISSSDEKVFEIDNTGIDDWQTKQTPDLGEKDNPPDYLKNHFDLLNQQSNDSQISRNLEKNSLMSKERAFKCQKVLFK